MSPEEWLAQQDASKEAPAATTEPKQLSPEEWAASQPKPEKPMTERIFGEGVRPNATAGERVLATTEAGVGAAAFGVAAQRIAAKMAARHMAAAATGIGATPLVQGGLLAMDLFDIGKVAIGMGAAGAVGSLIEQTVANMGYGRGTQVAAGAIMPGATATAIRGGAQAIGAAIPKVANVAANGLGAMGAPKAGYFIRGVSNLAKTGEQAAQQEAIDAERAALLGKYQPKPESATVAGEALGKGVAEQTSRFRTAQELKQARIAGLISKEEAVKAEAALAKEQAQPGIIPNADSLELGGKAKLGGEMRTSIESAEEPLLKERAAGYKDLLKKATLSARDKEQVGQHFGASEEGQKIKTVLDEKIKGVPGETVTDYTPDQKAQFTKYRDQIFGKPPKLDAEGNVVEAGTKPASSTALDTLTRRLGDAAFGKPAEGADAIDKVVAGELRDLILKGADGKGGVYAWEPKFAEAKQFYRDASDKLGPWATIKGKAVLSKEDFTGALSQRYKEEPEKVVDLYFKRSRGFEDLTKQLGDDTKQALKFSEKYATQNLEGKSSDAAEKWIKNQEWLSDPKAKPLRDKLETAVFEQRQKEGRALSLEEKVKSSKVVSEDKRSFLKGIDDKVASHYAELERIGKLAEPVISRAEKVIAGDLRDAELKSFKEILRSSPEARSAFPDVAIQYIVKGTGGEKIIERANKVTHNLQRAGLITKEEQASIVKDANKFAGVVEGTINNRKQLDAWSTHIAKRLNGILSRTASSAVVGHLNEGKE